MEASAKISLGILVMLAAMVAAVCCLLPPIPQPLSYHLFADQRSLWGIPNFGDVASNLPFALIGVSGLVFVLRSCHTRSGPFLDRREIWPYLFVFAGLVLTAFGSTYYHLAPDNARLVWDRLPIMITLMSMVAAVIMERISLRLGLWLLPILLLVGFASVLQWYWTEVNEGGDLRFYAGAQACSVLTILLALFMRPRYTHGMDFGLILGFYVLAKVFELFDVPIFAILRGVSGHTLKHVAAATAAFCILGMLRHRRPVRDTREAIDADPVGGLGPR